MAATAQGRSLTERHRLAQVELSQLAIRSALATWATIDADDIYESGRRWALLQLQALTAQNLASAELAAKYAQLFRAVEIGEVLDVPGVVPSRASSRVAQTFGRDVVAQLVRAGVAAVGILNGVARAEDFQVSTESMRALFDSLMVTGPVRVLDALQRGFTLDEAMRTAQVTVAGAIQRYTLDGGRNVLTGVLNVDPLAIRWARVTSGDPCSFCELLASRGYAYLSEESADFAAHDHCACTVEIGYEGQQVVLPESAERARENWDAFQASREANPEWYADLPGAYQSGDDKGFRRTNQDAELVAWRRWHEAQKTGVDPKPRVAPDTPPPRKPTTTERVTTPTDTRVPDLLDVLRESVEQFRQ